MTRPLPPGHTRHITDDYLRESAARDYFGRDYIPAGNAFDQPMLGAHVAFRAGWAAGRGAMTIAPPRRSPVEVTNPNAVYADTQARGELREALAVLLAHERAGKLSAWGLADALLAGPLAPLLAKLQAVEALVKAWEDDSRDWYYENRHTHEQGIHYVAGYEDGWERASRLLRRALATITDKPSQYGTDTTTEENTL